MKSKYFDSKEKVLLSLLLLVMMGLFVISLCSCSSDGSPNLAGRWENLNGTSWVEFTKTKIKWDNSPSWMNYEIKGDRINYDISGGGQRSVNFRFVDNDNLLIDGRDYKRVKK